MSRSLKFSLSRRDLLRNSSCGFGYLALAGLLGQQSRAAIPDATLKDRWSAQRARAKRVIFLCMSGGPSHIDTFDYKPQTGKKPHPGSVFDFKQYGESGLTISELFPETAKHADRLCVLNGMYCDTGIHAQSMLHLHTGDRLRARPSIGSWVSYGLGTENQNLPGFIALNTNKPQHYSSAFLPPIYNGTPIGKNGENMSTATIGNIKSSHLSLSGKRKQLDFVQAMNREHQSARAGDDNLDSVIRTMELGFRMQASAPDLLDISTESPKTLEQYRVGKSNQVGVVRPSDFGRQCLLARRFAEAGVRFIELKCGSWDQHKDYRRDLKANCDAVDAPISALLGDLDQRGLLEETLVVWGGEFGRPGLTPGDGKDATGHNSNGFTFWMAGGGVKPGFAYGKTDAKGAKAVDGKVHFRDLHATILHLLGLSANDLKFQHAGREHRLTGPDGGRVVEEIMA